LGNTNVQFWFSIQASERDLFIAQTVSVVLVFNQKKPATTQEKVGDFKCIESFSAYMRGTGALQFTDGLQRAARPMVTFWQGVFRYDVFTRCRARAHRGTVADHVGPRHWWFALAVRGSSGGAAAGTPSEVSAAGYGRRGVAIKLAATP